MNLKILIGLLVLMLSGLAYVAYAEYQQLQTENLDLIYTVRLVYLNAHYENLRNMAECGPLAAGYGGDLRVNFTDVMWKSNPNMVGNRVISG